MRDMTRESKWDPVYEGPFTVVRKNRGGAYVLKDKLGKLKRTVPADHLKLVVRQGEKAAIEDPTYEIKEIADHRQNKNGKMSYYVIWKDPNVSQAGNQLKTLTT